MPDISQPTDEMSATNRSGRAMPVTTNTRDPDGTTTESRAPGDIARRPDRARHAKHRRDAERAADALGGRVVARGDERGVGDRRRADPLAQPSGGQRLILQVVFGDEQQIDVARQLEMLKAIVQQVDGRAEPALREPARQIAIGADQHADAGQRAGEHQRLVAGLIEIGQHAGRRRRRR